MARPMVPLALALAMLAFPASAGAAANLPNLLKNGDAEDGPGAMDSTTKVPVPEWTTTGDFTVMQYGTPGFADSPDGGASNMFVGGPNAADSTATQVVDVSGNAEPIDNGARQVRLSALLGGFADQADQGIVEAHFLGAGHTELGHFSIGPVTPADRHGETGLLRRAATHAVPSGTRSIVVIMIASKANGVYNDGYLDDVALRMSAVPTAPTRWSFGFRVARVDRELSFGAHGSFTTTGQPDGSGELKVRTVSAPSFTVRYSYRGRQYHVVYRFQSRGTWAPAARDLTLYLRVGRTNVPHCGGVAELSFYDAVVTLRSCGAQLRFSVPEQATYHVT